MTIVRFGTFDFTVTAIEADAWALRPSALRKSDPVALG